LSKQLKVIALHIEKNRDHVGIEGIREWRASAACNPRPWCALPSTSGFRGSSELQAIFRENLSRQLAPSRNYKARIRDPIESGSNALSSVDIAEEFLAGSVAGMHELESSLDATAFKKAVRFARRQ